MNKEVVLTPKYPWFLVEVVEGVDTDQIVQDGIAQVKVDNKFQGKYMNICRIIKTPDAVPADTILHAGEGDYIGVWATAVETFNLFEHGNVNMVRNPDIFIVLDTKF